MATELRPQNCDRSHCTVDLRKSALLGFGLPGNAAVIWAARVRLFSRPWCPKQTTATRVWRPYHSQQLINPWHSSTTHPLDGTVLALRKLTSTPGLSHGGCCRRKNVPTNQRLPEYRRIAAVTFTNSEKVILPPVSPSPRRAVNLYRLICFYFQSRLTMSFRTFFLRSPGYKNVP